MKRHGLIVTTLAAVGLLATAATASRAAEAVRLADLSHIHGIAVDAGDPSRLVLATHTGLYLASPDGTAVQISDNRHDYMGFAPHPSDPETMFASGHPATGGNLGLIVSNDAGATWRQVSPGAGGPVDFHAMDVSAADPDVIYGLFGAIQVSRDGGETWEIAGAPAGDIFDIAASALDPDLVYAATRAGLMVSRDGARTWEPTGPANQPAAMVHVGPNGNAYAFVLGSGLLRAPGAALSWQPVSTGYGEQILLHLAIDPTDPNRMFTVTNQGQILASQDGGATWSRF